MSFTIGQKVRIVGNNPDNPDGRHYLKVGTIGVVTGMEKNGTILVKGQDATTINHLLDQGIVPGDLMPVEASSLVEFIRKMQLAFPDATYDEDNDGQLIIYTNLTVDDDDNVTSMGDI